MNGECTVACVDDPWEGMEPESLPTVDDGVTVEGYVCVMDPSDSFSFASAGPAYITIEVAADPTPGDVEVVLLNANNQILQSSSTTKPLDVIHTEIGLPGSYHVQVNLMSGQLGVPYRLHLRRLPK